MNKLFRKNHVLLLASCALVACILISWIFYGLLGGYLLEILYRSESNWIVDDIMQHRAFIPLKTYHQAADRLMVVNTFRAVTVFLVLALLAYKPLGVALACCSALFTISLLIFLFELFPFLPNSMRIDTIEYYAYRRNYIHDTKLVYTPKSLVSHKTGNFRGAHYAPIYNIFVEPRSVHWVSDEEGFRNSSTPRSADVLIIGDSFVEYGNGELDIFPKLLEKRLLGLTVANLGRGGYGPFQYLEVLKRYGIHKSPKLALLAFYEGNDIIDTSDYLHWENGDNRGQLRKIHVALSGNFLQRYAMAWTGVIQYFKSVISLPANLTLRKIEQFRGYIHPDIAVLSVGNETYKILFKAKMRQEDPGKLLEIDEIRSLKSVLSGFKSVCEGNHIIPIVLYIPAAAHIYAEYSTPESGGKWLSVRYNQIHSKKNLETAVTRLVQELKVGFISLSSVFEQAAKNGEMLYYAVNSQRSAGSKDGYDNALDSHWNRRGREIAAIFVAEVLKEKFNQPLYDQLKK